MRTQREDRRRARTPEPPAAPIRILLVVGKHPRRLDEHGRAAYRRAIPLGHGIRTGLEDTPVLPDGRRARDNAELVAAAAAMLGR